MKKILFAALLAASPVALVAQEGCAENAMTTIEMRQCSAWQAAAADSLLLELQRDLLERLPEQRDALSGVHVLWEDLRTRDCALQASVSDGGFGGSIQSVGSLSCIAAYASVRIRRLSILVCEGGGMMGECPESVAYVTRLEKIGLP